MSGRAWIDALDPADLPGLMLRAMAFKPTFQKCAGKACGGVQLHVVEPRAIRSLRSSWAMLRAAYKLGGSHFAWRTERYEFVDDRPAIDLLAGGGWLREMVEAGASVAEMAASQAEAQAAFVVRRRPFLRY